MFQFAQNRSNLPIEAKWYKPITTNSGEEKRYAAKPAAIFQCRELTPGQVGKTFRDTIESLTYSAILATTDIINLTGMEHSGGQLEFNGARRIIQYAQYNSARKIYTIAVS